MIKCSVQFSHSVVSDSLRPHEPQHSRQASLSITNSQSPPKPMSIESVMPSNHLILSSPSPQQLLKKHQFLSFSFPNHKQGLSVLRKGTLIKEKFTQIRTDEEKNHRVMSLNTAMKSETSVRACSLTNTACMYFQKYQHPQIKNLRLFSQI